MHPDLDELYRVLGAPVAAAAPPRPINETGFESTEAAPERSRDLAPLDAEGAQIFEEMLREQPEWILGRARAAFDRDISLDELRTRVADARRALEAPKRAADLVRAERFLQESSSALPPEFTFDGMNLAEIPIDPSNTKFEELADWLGWVVNSARWVFGSPAGAKSAFHWHTSPAYGSDFVYPLHGDHPGAALSVALFADFGTGLYHSRYIARQIARRKHPYAIHLGDVYYAGREAEFSKFFREPLDPLLGATRLFTMNGNHEMFSLGAPYFRYIDDRRAAHPGMQEQEGSYFCLRGERLQIIGLDTDYFGQGRHDDPTLLAWLEKQLEHGRSADLTNVLLTGDEPYEYGSTKLTKLLSKDLRDLVIDRKLVDLWFWGNTHYCALFEASDALPFVGSCIGHGGFPYGVQRPGRPTPAKVRFLETSARFPASTQLRQDRGNNGYCALQIDAGGALGLTYVDWMNHERCLASLSRTPNGVASLGQVRVY
jgi:hypothetical protein